jgi:sugar transferase (PEP-CTERM/EpsH1 system associated)
LNVLEALPTKILFLVHRLPYPPDKGDRIRTYHLLRYLARRAEVHVLALSDEPVASADVAALQQLCERVAVVGLGKSRWLRAAGSFLCGRTVTTGAFTSTRFSALARQWAQGTRYDYCLVSSSGMVPYLQSPHLRHIPAVIDLIDVDSQKWLDYAQMRGGWRRWLYRVEGRRLRSLEQSLPAWAQAVTLVSRAEVDIYQSFCAPGSIHAVTNGVDLDYFQPAPPSSEESCVFVGAFDYPPNIDGACWFAQDVWPQIRRQRPEARLWLVGRRPVPAVQRLAALPGIEVVGAVADVRPFVARAALAVIPLRVARGVQNKVLEAMAMSRAVVTSPRTLAGLKARAGEDLLAASSPHEWCDAILHLLSDQELRERLGAAARRYVETHHQWDHCLEPFATIMTLNPEPAAWVVGVVGSG